MSSELAEQRWSDHLQQSLKNLERFVQKDGLPPAVAFFEELARTRSFVHNDVGVALSFMRQGLRAVDSEPGGSERRTLNIRAALACLDSFEAKFDELQRTQIIPRQFPISAM